MFDDKAQYAEHETVCVWLSWHHGKLADREMRGSRCEMQPCTTVRVALWRSYDARYDIRGGCGLALCDGAECGM